MKLLSFTSGSIGENKFIEYHLKESIKKVNVKNLLNYSEVLGMSKLRNQIVNINKLDKKVFNKYNVLITSSSQQALNIIFNYLTDKYTIRLFVQEPAYFGLFRVITKNNRPLEVITFSQIKELFSIIIDQKLADKTKINVVYLTSNFNGITTTSISLTSKKKLAKLANENKLLIIEDNPYDFLYYSNNKPDSILNFASKNVIYISSFSKLVSPGLRLGYIISSEKQINFIKSYKLTLDVFTSTLSQEVCFNIIKDKEYLPKLRNNFKDKRNNFYKELDKNFNNNSIISYSLPKGGIFLSLKLNNKYDLTKLITISRKNGLVLENDNYSYLKKNSPNTFRINFVQNNSINSIKGIRILKKSLLELIAKEKIR